MIYTEINWMAFIVILAVTAIASYSFCLTASKLSVEAIGRPIHGTSWVIWTLGPLLLQTLIALFAFLPVTYIVIMSAICVLEWITIRRPHKKTEGSNGEAEVDNGEEEPDFSETPSRRFFSWFVFSLPAEAGLMLSITYAADHGGPEMSLRLVLLGLIPLIIVVFVGLIRLVLCGVEEGELDEEEAPEGDEDDGVTYVGSEDLGSATTAADDDTTATAAGNTTTTSNPSGDAGQQGDGSVAA